MSLLITTEVLTARRIAAAGPLKPLAQSLAADLTPLLGGELYFPTQKALLSREGGRCALDGTLLEFDPFKPHEHRCPRCGTRYEGDLHDRFWIYWYQLWLAERAVHAAALAALGEGDDYARLVAAILDGYAERYSSYPNADNVLGPTRLFFSTYLESIWLLQICMATDLLGNDQRALADRVRDRIVEPSRAIIAEYNEGASNRQVWNAAALMAAGRLLGDEHSVNEGVHGRGGLVFHLGGGLLADGTWYEGENYHLFAHRGLWYGVTMAEVAGIELPASLVARFDRGFVTPFLSALPDLTLPSRRDSQYAISLRQWRIAEHCELGFARAGDSVIGGALARLYDDALPRRETGRRISSADVERNAQPSALTRADLSWRALLCARESLPVLEPIVPGSALLGSQGLAVFRRDAGRAYVALDYGHSGGGHGHPDRLNLLLANGGTRWLDDYGTGSYVDPTLHWYRSTLAHNAPLVNGESQRRVTGRLAAYDERGAAGWISAVADGIAPGVRAARTIVVMPGYLIDEMTWESRNDATIDLPVHLDVAFDDGSVEPAPFIGSQASEDGFRFVRDTGVEHVPPGETTHGIAIDGQGEHLDVFAYADHAVDWWRAVAPGPPGGADRAFRVARAVGTDGRSTMVIAWDGGVSRVSVGDGVRVELSDGTRHEHSRTESGWHVELVAGAARSSIDLGGVVSSAAEDVAAAAVATVAAERAAIELPRHGDPVAIALADIHYRRSEQAWVAAGSPTASVSLQWTGTSLRVVIDVPVSDLTFVDAAALNPYDNEHPDINGDSVQLYLGTDRGRSGWILVPDPNSATVRVRTVEGWSDPATMVASWERVGAGYRLSADISEAVPQAIDVVVNEMPRGRERRRGQLVLSGGAGEFVYLRGDRHDAAALVPLRLPDV